MEGAQGTSEASGVSRRVHDIPRSNEALRNGAVHRILNMTTALGRAALAAMPIVFLLRKVGPPADAAHAVRG